MNSSSRVAVASVLSLSALAVGTVLDTAAAAPPGVIEACADKNSGDLRILFAGQTCERVEVTCLS